ncbi:MAG: hypothetical protein SVR08_10910 [Spirochaetota bacterium]|nr:hypothetical protein [Spirochaetota bacterium]
MNLLKYRSISVISVLIPAFLIFCATKEDIRSSGIETGALTPGSIALEINGKVSVKGNEPHTYLVIITRKYGALKIVGAFEKEIRRNYQQKYIKVNGKVVKKTIGPGFPAEFKVTEIIEIR